MSDRPPILRVILFGAALFAVLVPARPVLAQRALTFPERDGFGHLAYNQDAPFCAADFVDIASTGAVVAPTPSGADPALDDGGAVVSLAEPFSIYGTSTSTLVVSTNGYLAAASALGLETGGDFSNDCPLPAVAEEGPSSALRVAVLHDDLDGTAIAGPGTEGAIYHQHFTVCPRPSAALGVESCTVVQWSDWRVVDSTAVFGLQAVLYHQSSEIALQYTGNDYDARPTTADPHGATVGLQDAAAGDGLTAACDLRTLPMTGSAFCIFDPGFPPPTGDLWVELDDKTDFPAPGGQLDYVLTVVNPGPAPVAAAPVALALPPEITGCSWTCLASPGSFCTAAGSGPPVADSVDLAVGGSTIYTLLCDVDPAAAGGTLVASASVAAPDGHDDPDLANNTASVSTDIPIPVTLQRFSVR